MVAAADDGGRAHGGEQVQVPWVLSSRTATAMLEGNSNTVYVEQKRIERGRWSRVAAGFIQKIKQARTMGVLYVPKG